MKQINQLDPNKIVNSAEEEILYKLKKNVSCNFYKKELKISLDFVGSPINSY